MIEESDVLVLEILKQGEYLKMSAFARGDFIQTIRHYSQTKFLPQEAANLSREIISILNKIQKKAAGSLSLARELQKTSQVFWDHFITKPVKDRLKKTQSANLVLLIDEELIGIPWELLYDGNDFLCLKFNLGRLIRSKQELVQPQYRSLPPKLKMLILANPTNDLKSAYLEGVYIKNQLDRKSRHLAVDFKSSYIDSMYVKKNLRDYDIVHFAGHCEYDQKSVDNSGWVLSDSRFTGKDIFALGHSLSLPSLIFSNACYSAQIPSDSAGMDCQQDDYSLASAFLFSGVRHYIGAMQKIEDPVSSVFAKEFYNLVISGNSVGRSMQQARMKLIKEHGIDSVSWASYILYGDPSFILFRAPASKVKAIRHKPKLILGRKNIIKITAAVVVLFLAISVYFVIPSLNPGAYASFLKSRSAYAKGDNDKAIMHLRQALDKDPSFLPGYPLLAEAYLRLGNRADALRQYFNYAVASGKKKNNVKLASAYVNIGWIYYLQGEYEKAMDFYSKALDASIKNRDKLNEAAALRKMALLFMDRRDYEQALSLLTKSSEINRSRQNIYQHKYNLACDYFDIGLVFANKEDFIAAKEFYEKSRQLFSRLRIKDQLSDHYFNLGELCLFDKEYAKALEFYRKGMEIDRQQGNKPNIAAGCNMMGELYVEMGDLAEAQSYFDKAVSLSSEIDIKPELAGAYYNLGLLYKDRGDKRKARQYLRLAQEIYVHINTPDYEDLKQELLALE